MQKKITPRANPASGSPGRQPLGGATGQVQAALPSRDPARAPAAPAAAAGAAQPLPGEMTATFKARWTRVLHSWFGHSGRNGSVAHAGHTGQSGRKAPEGKAAPSAARPSPAAATGPSAPAPAAAASTSVAAGPRLQQRDARTEVGGHALNAAGTRPMPLTGAQRGSFAGPASGRRILHSFLRAGQHPDTLARSDPPTDDPDASDFSTVRPAQTTTERDRGDVKSRPAPAASAAEAAPADPGTFRVSTFTVRGDRGRDLPLAFASMAAPPPLSRRYLLGMDSPLSFSRPYDAEVFHHVLADELVSAWALAQVRNQSLYDYLSDDEQLRARPPREGRRIRAHLFNIRNDPAHPPAPGVTGERLKRVVHLFNTRIREQDPTSDAHDPVLIDLTQFITDLHQGRITQLIPGTREHDEFRRSQRSRSGQAGPSRAHIAAPSGPSTRKTED